MQYICKKTLRFFLKKTMISKLNVQDAKLPKYIRLNVRSSKIIKSFYKVHLLIHNGRVYKKLRIRKFLMGKSIGEFAFTRKPFYYPEKKKKRR